MIRKHTCSVHELSVQLICQCVQKDWRAQIILQLLPHIVFFDIGRGCWAEQVGLDLRLQSPPIYVILELQVLIEHLWHRCRLTAHFFEQLSLLGF